MITAYLAADGFSEQLQEELRRAGAVVTHRHERLFVCEGPAVAAAWAANIWHDCRELAGRIDRQRRQGPARYPAQLGDVRAAASPARRADPGAPAARFGQAHRLSRRRADGAARLVDVAGARPRAGGGDVQLPFRQRRTGLRRGQGRSAQPCLPEALGGAGAARPLAAARRALPRSRRLTRRLDLGAGEARRRGGCRRQGAARSQGGGDARCRAGAARAPSHSSRPASAPSTGCSPTSSAIRRGCSGWSRHGDRRAWCAISSARSSSRARPTTMRRPRSPPFPERRFCTCTTTSTS